MVKRRLSSLDIGLAVSSSLMPTTMLPQRLFPFMNLASTERTMSRAELRLIKTW